MRGHVDTHVGREVRRCREVLDMTQQELATKAGVSLQQIQMYEGGMDSIGASRLWVIAEALGVTVLGLFEGLKQDTQSGLQGDVFSDPKTAELFRAYRALSKAN